MYIQFDLQLCGAIILIQIFNLITTTESEFSKKCSYEYTVDLTESNKFYNNSYLYNNKTIIPPDLVQEYKYKILENDQRIYVKPYKRGCICKVKQCLRFCLNEIITEVLKYNSTLNEVTENFILNITLNNGTIVEKNLITDFHPLYGRICTAGTDLVGPKLLPNYDWTLYENSLLLRNRDKKKFTLDEYCFDVNISNDEFEYFTYPLICVETLNITWFQTYGVFISTPFFIITIILSNYLQQLRNSRGKCYVTYLSFVTLSYVLISCNKSLKKYLKYEICQTYGYVLYYAITSYLTWTCLLSYDTWKCLTNMVTKQPSYLKYSYMGCGIPSLVTFLIFILNCSNVIPDSWKPGIRYNQCGVDVSRWSALIYYFIPGLAVFIYSLTLYIMIVRFSWTNKEKLRSYLEEIQELQIERFFLYFRIFILIGCYWFLDLLIYLIKITFSEEERTFLYILYASSILKSFQGFLVFLVFVCRKPTLNEIKERFSRKSSTDQRKLSINTSMEMRIEAFRKHYHQ